MSFNKGLSRLTIFLATIMVVSILGLQHTYARPEVTIVPMDTEKEIIVELRDDSFNPNEISLPSGQETRLILKNVGQKEHTFTVEKLGIDVEIQPGKEEIISVKPEMPGTYELICRYHAQEGMVGKVIVQ